MADILAIGAHPDDVELGCGGTLLKHKKLGHSIAICDLTQGELGTRGSAAIRMEESKVAAGILGVESRINLGFADGFFTNDREHLLEVVKVIRHVQPKIILTNAKTDRHPDHGKAAELIRDAAFYSGLRRIETKYNGKSQDAWRPQAVYHYIQFRHLKPDILVDVSDFMEKKMLAIKAYKSQFHDPDSNEPETFISSSNFLEFIQARTLDFGKELGVAHAEGFTVNRTPAVEDLLHLK